MPIPTYDAVMLPMLRLLADGQARRVADLREALAAEFGLSDEERQRPLPSGRATYWRSRVGWARTYLHKAGAVELPRRGHVRITARGREVLAAAPGSMLAFLDRYPEFAAFRRGERADETGPSSGADDAVEQPPVEAMATAYRRHRRQLESELLEQVLASSPAFFEQLVVDLLVAMGYGGSQQDAAQALGRTGDGGVDGIIREDRLGLEVIYVQAKRWTDTVGRPHVQQFAGALQGRRARKGVFMTTSEFSSEAKEFVAHIDSKIVLVDGKQLAALMVDHDVGVSNVMRYEWKRVDEDFFSET